MQQSVLVRWKLGEILKLHICYKKEEREEKLHVIFSDILRSKELRSLLDYHFACLRLHTCFGAS